MSAGNTYKVEKLDPDYLAALKEAVEEGKWEYGYNTGSTVTFVGDRSQIEEWALVRGMAVGSGDWGSRIVRRRKAGAWEEVGATK